MTYWKNLPQYTFDWKVGRYRGANGKFLPDWVVRDALDQYLRHQGLEAKALAMQYQRGAISLAQWEAGMRRTVKNTHLYSAAIAKGGWDQMTPADYGLVGNRVRTQYAYLGGFVQDLENGYPLDGRFPSRSEMYTEAGRQTFYEEIEAMKAARGYTHERNVIDPDAESCEECLELTARGWVPIGTLKPLGSRQCLTRCRCHLQYGWGDKEQPSPPGAPGSPPGPRVSWETAARAAAIAGTGVVVAGGLRAATKIVRRMHAEGKFAFFPASAMPPGGEPVKPLLLAPGPKEVTPKKDWVGLVKDYEWQQRGDLFKNRLIELRHKGTTIAELDYFVNKHTRGTVINKFHVLSPHPQEQLLDWLLENMVADTRRAGYAGAVTTAHNKFPVKAKEAIERIQKRESLPDLRFIVSGSDIADPKGGLYFSLRDATDRVIASANAQLKVSKLEMMVIVGDEFRRQGIGTSLVDYGLKQARFWNSGATLAPLASAQTSNPATFGFFEHIYKVVLKQKPIDHLKGAELLANLDMKPPKGSMVGKGVQYSWWHQGRQVAYMSGARIDGNVLRGYIYVAESDRGKGLGEAILGVALRDARVINPAVRMVGPESLQTTISKGGLAWYTKMYGRHGPPGTGPMQTVALPGLPIPQRKLLTGEVGPLLDKAAFDALNEQYWPYMQSLGRQQWDLIDMYVEDSEWINLALRKGHKLSPFQTEKMRWFDQMFREAPRLKQDVRVWRGEKHAVAMGTRDWRQQMENWVGREYWDRGYMSTSTSHNVAIGFLDPTMLMPGDINPSRTMFEIIVPKGTRVLWIGEHEAELLLHANSWFTVEDVKLNYNQLGGYWYHYVRLRLFDDGLD